ncbi:MAG: hypothetical protein AB8B69_10880 [Chitinophagales bacterium]
MSSTAKEPNKDSKPSSTTSKKKGAKSFFKRMGLILFLVLLVGAASFFGVSSMTYSEGTRAGYLIKISKKGFVFKTYEGQLNLGGVGSAGDVTAIVGNDIWEFSVSDDAVFQKMQEFEGKRVSLNYEEIIRSFPWQGDTNYFITDIEPIQ